MASDYFVCALSGTVRRSFLRGGRFFLQYCLSMRAWDDLTSYRKWESTQLALRATHIVGEDPGCRLRPVEVKPLSFGAAGGSHEFKLTAIFNPLGGNRYMKARSEACDCLD
jgi:hypothetical protein